MNAIELIKQERQRQIEVEGHTPENDLNYVNGELAKAAGCYALADDARRVSGGILEPFVMWPWSKEHWKPTENNRIKELVKAGALIVAEIERLQQEPKPIQEMNIKKFEELQPLVIQWAKEKGIFEKGNPLAQCSKTFEEVEELKEALECQSKNITTFVNSKFKTVISQEEIKDALGDILVTIIIQSEMQGLDLMDCLQSAYDVISKRTGKMVEGQFVKDE